MHRPSARAQLRPTSGITPLRSSPVYCNTTRRDQMLVGNAHDQHVSERIATRDHSPSCYPDAGCQDHSVRRMGDVVLTSTLIERNSKTVRPSGTHQRHAAVGVKYLMRSKSCTQSGIWSSLGCLLILRPCHAESWCVEPALFSARLAVSTARVRWNRSRLRQPPPCVASNHLVDMDAG